MGEQILQHAPLKGVRPVTFGENGADVGVHLGLGEAHHLEGMLLQGDDLRDVEVAGEVVNGDGEHAGDKDAGMAFTIAVKTSPAQPFYEAPDIPAGRCGPSRCGGGAFIRSGAVDSIR